MLLGEGEPSDGWGRNQTIEIGESKLFVKRIPVTDIELENMFSTANLYALPTFYNYGVGSVGFSVWRELVAHIKTTNWALSGACPNFPLLYHYRIVPLSGAKAELDEDEHNGYVEYWDSNEKIGQYLRDRVAANHELILFLEYIPNVLHPWLQENSGQIDDTLEQLRSIFDFLYENEIIHLDAHSGNVLTDGETVYLTDFGLLVDKSFSLQDAEIAFFDEHRYFDYGEILSEVGYLVYTTYDALPEEEQAQIRKQLNISAETHIYEVNAALLENVESLCTGNLLSLNENLYHAAVKYRPIIQLVIHFFRTLQQNNQKNTPCPNAELERLLKESGFVGGE